MEPLAEVALTVLVSAFVGSYLGGYLKRKGENLATHEDVNKLLAQVAAVTTTTKEIEAKISSEVWDRQKLWELRREVLFEATRRLSEVDDSLISLDSVLQVERLNQRQDDESWLETKSERLARWSKASAAFDETALFVAVVCKRETKESFDDFRRLTRLLAAGIAKRDPEIYSKSRGELATRFLAVRAAIRGELGVDDLV